MTLVDLAVELGVLRLEGVHRLRAGQEPGEPVQDALVRLGLATREQVLALLAEWNRRLGACITGWCGDDTVLDLLSAGLRPETRRLGVRAGSVPQPGEIWAGGRYEIVRALGQGAMGLVYLARQTAAPERIVLKLMKRPWDEDAGDRFVRFQREMRALQELRHSRIARLLDAGMEIRHGRSIPWLATEYREGEPLSEWALEHEVTVEQALGLVESLADACGHAHERGFVHRDVKPANVLVEPETETPVLIDFGLVRFLPGGAPTIDISSRAVIGTPQFMSPEQRKGERAGPQADVYALAGLLVWLLTGRAPNQSGSGTSGGEVPIDAASLAGPRSAREALVALLRRAMAVDPKQRPPDGNALAGELNSLRESLCGLDGEA